MSNKILSITEKLPTPVTLPDGTYFGVWGGYIISLKYKNKEYELTTEETEWNEIKVAITIKDSVATFETIIN